MKFEIVPFFKLQILENNITEKHIIIRYISPGINYSNVTLSDMCMGVTVINCHDIENPMTPFNAQIIKDYPHFYKGPLIYFDERMAEHILNFVYFHKDDIDLIICQCHVGISRSSATAAVLSKIFNNDDSWVFENKHFIYSSEWSWDNQIWVPNNLIYRTIWNRYCYERSK